MRRTLSIAALIGALTGCSLLTVRGPDQAQTGAPMCTRDARLPIVVDGLGALAIGGTGLAAASEGSDSGTQGAGYALIGLGALMAVSAIVGIQRQDVCSQAWDHYAATGTSSPPFAGTSSPLFAGQPPAQDEDDISTENGVKVLSLKAPLSCTYKATDRTFGLCELSPQSCEQQRTIQGGGFDPCEPSAAGACFVKKHVITGTFVMHCYSLMKICNAFRDGESAQDSNDWNFGPCFVARENVGAG